METIKKYWFVATTIALVVIYFLYDRRGRRIEQLLFEAQKQLLANQLRDIRTRADAGGETFNEAMEDYQKLKARHGDLLGRLGIGIDEQGRAIRKPTEGV